MKVVRLEDKRQEEKAIIQGIWEMEFSTVIERLQKDPDSISVILVVVDRDADTMMWRNHNLRRPDFIYILEKIKQLTVLDDGGEEEYE